MANDGSISFDDSDDGSISFDAPKKEWDAGRVGKALTVGLVSDVIPGTLGFAGGALAAAPAAVKGALDSKSLEGTGEAASKAFQAGSDLFPAWNESAEDFRELFGKGVEYAKEGLEYLSDKEADLLGLAPNSPLRHARKALAYALPELLGVSAFSALGKKGKKKSDTPDLKKSETGVEDIVKTKAEDAAAVAAERGPPVQGEIPFDSLPGRQLELDYMNYPDPHQGPPQGPVFQGRQGTQLELPLRPDEPPFGEPGRQLSLGEMGGLGPEGFVDQPPLSVGNLEAYTNPRGEGLSRVDEAGIQPRGEGDIPPSAVRDLFAEDQFKLQNPEFDLDIRATRRRDNLYSREGYNGPLDPQVVAQRADAIGGGITEGVHSVRQHSEPLRNNRQAGFISPELLIPDFLARIAERIHGGWQNNRVQFGNNILDAFKGLFSEGAITFAKAQALTNDHTRRIAIIPPNMYEAMTSKRDLGFNSERATKMANLRELEASNTPIKKFPEITVDKITGKDGQKYWAVVDHDGRHRAQLLFEKGVTNMPVIIKDRTGGLLNKESPELIRSQDGSTSFRLPPDLYPKKPKLGGVGKKQGGAIDFRAFFGRTRSAREAEVNSRQMTDIYFKLDDRDPSTFMAEVPKPLHDMDAQFGVQGAVFRSLNALLKNPNDAATKVYHYINSALGLAKEREHIKNYQYRDRFEELYHMYGLGLFGKDRPEGRRQWAQDITLIKKFEDDPTTWFNGKDYYPSFEQLREAGLSERKAKAWRDIFNMMEDLWPVIETTAKMTGREAPKRIPGYLPRMWKGPYSVEIVNGKGTQVKELNFYSRKSQEMAYQQLANNLPDDLFLSPLENPKPIPSIGVLLDELNKTREVYQNHGLINALIANVYDSQAKGMITHAFDRTSNKKGDLISRSVEALESEGNIFGLKDKYEYKSALESIQKYSETVIGWEERVKLMNDVLLPMLKNGYLDQPNLKAAVGDVVNSYFGISEPNFKTFEAGVRGMLIKLGADPGIVSAFTKATSTWMSRAALTGNIPYYIANTAQWSLTPIWLLNHQAKAKAWGDRTGSISKAMYDTIAMKDREMLWKEGKKRGYVDNQLTESLDPSRWRDPIGSTSEQGSRFTSFMMAYHYFRQFKSEADALKFAGFASDAVGVVYDKGWGSPVAANKLAGQSASPLVVFTTFASHMLGFVSNLPRSGGASKTKALQVAAKTIGAFTLLQAGLWGLTGLPFVQMYNKLIYETESDLPTSKELARNLNLGELGEFGSISALMGQDISQSASGVGLPIPGELLYSWLTVTSGMGSMFWTGVKRGEVPTKQEMWEVGRKIPNPTARAVFEHSLKNRSLNDIANTFTQKYKENPDWAPMRDINRKSEYERTPVESFLSVMGTGLYSTEERKFQTSQQIYARSEKKTQDRANKILQHLKEGGKSMTKSRADSLWKEFDALGLDPTMKATALMAYQLTEEFNNRELLEYGSTTLEGLRKAEKYDRIRQQEPQQFLPNFNRR